MHERQFAEFVEPEDPKYLLATQSTQAGEPATSWYLPATHCLQLMVSVVCFPVTAAEPNFPGLQELQSTSPSTGLYFPNGQSIQVDESLAFSVELKVPATHEVHGVHKPPHGFGSGAADEMLYTSGHVPAGQPVSTHSAMPCAEALPAGQSAHPST